MPPCHRLAGVLQQTLVTLVRLRSGNSRVPESFVATLSCFVLPSLWQRGSRSRRRRSSTPTKTKKRRRTTAGCRLAPLAMAARGQRRRRAGRRRRRSCRRATLAELSAELARVGRRRNAGQTAHTRRLQEARQLTGRRRAQIESIQLHFQTNGPDYSRCGTNLGMCGHTLGWSAVKRPKTRVFSREAGLAVCT
jgi:hypothetical protein